MRSTTPSLVLLLAAATTSVLGAPIPAVLIADWEGRLVAMANHHAALAVHHRLPPAAVAALVKDAEMSLAAAINNQHYTPSGTLAPSAVLATPRPIETTYLMGLGPAPTATRTAVVMHTEAPASPIRVDQDHPRDGHNHAEIVLLAGGAAATTAWKQTTTMTTKTAKTTTPIPAPTAAPVTNQHDPAIPGSLRMEAHPQRVVNRVDLACYYAQLRRDYNDMMVISLVAVFLLVIVAVELWDNNQQTPDEEDALVGAIKLEHVPAEKQPLSVQASPVRLATTTHEVTR
ncbi:hypothetical protein SPI_04782 [Niveomyces insectorum RCEF 264]|uniref:Uncharacterized protein n=1 Tax=Niveomyces insectorum RCEF 264 TaxID=1081102 RepID=A0A167UUF3_9HYPO|nr:hypothetical protein SPI_04782 [Niveomyces insectorum RCEF 264]